MHETGPCYGTAIKVDLNGNVSFNLPPTRGTLENDSGTEYFVPKNKKSPIERYQVASQVFITKDLESAQSIYEQQIEALMNRAFHMIAQVTYCKIKYETEKDYLLSNQKYQQTCPKVATQSFEHGLMKGLKSQ